MDTEGSEMDAEGSLLRRACDQCRLRKIRCDKRSPCSNCSSSQIVCRSTGAGQRPPEQRRRVLISGQYENKINMIEGRLGGIEEVLHDLRATVSSRASNTPPPTSSRQVNSLTPSPANTLDQHEPVTPFEGSSSFTAYSTYASQFLENAVSENHIQMSTPKMNEALSTLKHLVNLQDTKSSSTKRGDWLPRRSVSSLQELPLPPMDLVLRILREMKNQPLPWMQGLAFIGIDRLTEKCREVFFATEDFSEEAFIIANGGLYFVFVDYMLMDTNQGMKDTYRECMNTTRANLESGLAELSYLMPATADTIAALSLGAIHAMDVSKPSFALTLTSAASHLCQTLGYHRASSMEHDNENVRQDKFALFWTVYCIDKSLSLRLGRAATIQDYDVSVPMAMNISGVTEPWKTIYHLWIQYARAQGRVYENLYSQMALNQPEEHRASQARKLASELQWIVMKPHKEMIDRQNLSLYDSLQVRADEVAHLALLTIIYRAIPAQDGTSGGLSSDCIETARAALECHQQSMDMMKEYNESEFVLSYLHWIILHSPFAPFIVLFCHVVKSLSNTDLQRLEDFVASLQPSCVLSEAISKLHRLCQVLTNIGRLYLEAKIRLQTQESQTMGQEFDTYLSALGLAPIAVDESDVRPMTASTTTAPVGSTNFMQGVQASVGAPLALQNWFLGNQYMMGLLEEDMPIFDLWGQR